jgi:hypothetical protein
MRATRIFSALFLFWTVAPALQAAQASRLVRVPQDAPTLAAAMSRVADGGVVQLAAGTYPSPPNGFAINNARKGFTVRAAAGAAVAIDGGGGRKLLRFLNSSSARGKLVTFERITFQNGYSAEVNLAGGVTLSAAQAVFRRCAFVGNRAESAVTGGGAVKALAGSSVTFIGCSFRENSSPLRGGALAVRDSAVTIQGGSFTANRTNLPGHNPRSFGGAIMVIDGTLSVSGVRFEGNQTGFAGGALYAIGNWDKGSNISVTGSTFAGNQAVADPCCTQPEPTTGGAIHVEDLTALRVQDSVFQGNRAVYGGAVDEYRADVEIHGSVFQANQTPLAAPQGGLGGAISAFSADSATDGDANRRPARLVVTQSLLQGGSGVATPPVSGGCILANGDTARMYGEGVAPAGQLADNRAQVQIQGVVFSDCAAQTSAGGSGSFGGALEGDLIDFDLEDSMVLGSAARGLNAAGGGLSLQRETDARILRTTFAGDSAQKWGGALYLNGSTVQVDGCRFYANDVVPGVSETLGESRGAAIYSIPGLSPAHPRNVGGVVSNSSFSENLGLPVWDLDPPSGPTNEMRYDGNRFSPTTFGDRVYVDTLASPGGASVWDLNVLAVYRAGRATTDKSVVANQPVFGPREGDLRLVPSPNGVGAAPAAPGASYLVYAWTGGSAAIGTVGLASKAGMFEVPPGSYTLAVDQTLVAVAKTAGSP